jgi:hypothetical protein
LVWLYCNLRLLKRTQALEQGMPARPWIAPTPEEEDEEQEQQQRKHPPGDVFFPYFSRILSPDFPDAFKTPIFAAFKNTFWTYDSSLESLEHVAYSLPAPNKA